MNDTPLRPDSNSAGPILGNRSLVILLLAGLALIVLAGWLSQVSRAPAEVETGDSEKSMVMGPTGAPVPSTGMPLLPPFLNPRERVEQYLQSEAETMLDAMLGPGHAIVRIHADLELDDRTETIAEARNSDDADAHVQIRRLLVSLAVDRTYHSSEMATAAAVELGPIEALVRNAIGFDSARGDRMELVSLPFAARSQNTPAAAQYRGAFGPSTLSIAWMVTCALVVLSALFVLVRGPILPQKDASIASVERGPAALPIAGAQSTVGPASTAPRSAQASGAFLAHARIRPEEAAIVIRRMMCESS